MSARRPSTRRREASPGPGDRAPGSARAWTVSDPEFQADAVVPLNPVYPWCGHRNFAYDLVRWMRPARVAELGVHWGTSFFAFAQAIKDARLPTALVGVDTFKGDDHAGLYGEEVFAAVNTISDRYFRAQRIVLHRMFFTDALEKVADASVDLLHIDGLHTHEAVRFDFLSWLPKLAPQGVILFHDTAPYTGYGSANFWKEVSGEYPSFAFEHSWGLGVLFPKGDARLRALRKQNLADKIGLYTYKGEFRLSQIKVRDLTKMAEERQAGIMDQTRMIQQRDARIVALAREVELLTRHRADLQERARQLVAERDAWVGDLRKSLNAAQSLAPRLQAAESLCRERYDVMQEMSRRIAEGDGAVERLTHRASALEANLAEAHAAAQRRTAEAESLEHRLKEQQAMNDDLKARVERVETDLELLAVRTEHVESVLGAQRARLDALMQTRAGRRAAARLHDGTPTPVVLAGNGIAGNGARG